MESFEEFPEL